MVVGAATLVEEREEVQAERQIGAIEAKKMESTISAPPRAPSSGSPSP